MGYLSFKLGLVAAILCIASICEGRPSDLIPRTSFIQPSELIVGGVDAEPGEFPWHLAQQRWNGGFWGFSCGGTLLSATYALTAAHCIDGASPDVLRVVAGLYNVDDETNGQSSIARTAKMHENYMVGAETYRNDIGIIGLETPIFTDTMIQYATLPSENSNQFAGQTCVITGWGSRGVASRKAGIMQKANIQVLALSECNSRLSGIALVGPGHLCVYDPAQTTGACFGDSGGPLHCVEGEKVVVAGATSWVVTSGGLCLTQYPQAYSRTSFYLDWIAANTP